MFIGIYIYINIILQQHSYSILFQVLLNGERSKLINGGGLK